VTDILPFSLSYLSITGSALALALNEIDCHIGRLVLIGDKLPKNLFFSQFGPFVTQSSQMIVDIGVTSQRAQHAQEDEVCEIIKILFANHSTFSFNFFNQGVVLLFEGKKITRKKRNVMNVPLLHRHEGYVNITNIGRVRRVTDAKIDARMISCVVYDSSLKTTLNQLGLPDLAPELKTFETAIRWRHRLNRCFDATQTHPMLPKQIHLTRVETRWRVSGDVVTLSQLCSFGLGAVPLSEVAPVVGVEIKCVRVPHHQWLSKINDYMLCANDDACGLGIGAKNAPIPFDQQDRERAKIADILCAYGRCRDTNRAKYMNSVVVWDPQLVTVSKSQIATSMRLRDMGVSPLNFCSGVPVDSIEAMLRRGRSSGARWVIDRNAKLTPRQKNQYGFHKKLMRIWLRVNYETNGQFSSRTNAGHWSVLAPTRSRLYNLTFRRFGVDWFEHSCVRPYTDLTTTDWRKLRKIYGPGNERIFRLLFSRRADTVNVDRVME